MEESSRHRLENYVLNLDVAELAPYDLWREKSGEDVLVTSEVLPASI